jgi:hypothetical protein
MSYGKHGLKALGLSFVAVLGLMAFMAAGASAAFLYLEESMTKTLAVDSEPVFSAHTDLTFLIPAENLKFLCQRVVSDPTAPITLLANSTVAHGHLLFKECEAFTISTNILQKNCTPSSPGTAAGEILGTGLAELILHPANNTMILFKPLASKPLFIIVLPELCVLAETSNVTGSFVTECGELKPANTFVGGNCATHRVTQLLKEIPAELRNTLGDKMKFGANEMFLDGIIAVKFGAPCSNCSWGGDAV